MWLTETKLLSLYSSAAFATIMESLLTKKKKNIPNTKTFQSRKVVVRRHLASIYDHQGKGWLVHLVIPNYFTPIQKKG